MGLVETLLCLIALSVAISAACQIDARIHARRIPTVSDDLEARHAELADRINRYMSRERARDARDSKPAKGSAWDGPPLGDDDKAALRAAARAQGLMR